MKSAALLLFDRESMEASTSSQLVHSSLLESRHDIPVSLQECQSHEETKNKRMRDDSGTSSNFKFQTEIMEPNPPGSSSTSSGRSSSGRTSTPWHAILYGQLLSVALTVSSATSLALTGGNSSSSSSSNSNASATLFMFMSTTPTFSLFCMYLLLALLHFFYWLYCQRQERQNAITALMLSHLTSAVDCTLDEAYPTWADKRHSMLPPDCNKTNNNNNNSSSSSHRNSLIMVVEQTDPSPSQSIDMELDLIRHYLPVSRYKFVNVSCSSSSWLNLHCYSWKQYCALAFLHVQGNYCLLKSFQYESFQTVILLQSISIPAAMITSAMFLRRHYTILHILGAILCISGSAFTFRDSIFHSTTVPTVSDSGDTTATTTTTTAAAAAASFSNPILIGDLLAISSAILSGISDVFAEQAVKCKGSIVEYLAMIGFFGSIISFVQVGLLELPHVLNLLLASTSASESTPETSVTSQLLLLSMFAFFNYMYYAGMSRFLLFSEATFLNLSMLSTDLWSIGFSIFQEHRIPSYDFFLSFATIAAGVLAYQKAPSPIVTDKDGEIELDEHPEDMEEPHSVRAANIVS